MDYEKLALLYDDIIKHSNQVGLQGYTVYELFDDMLTSPRVLFRTVIPVSYEERFKKCFDKRFLIVRERE